VAELEQVETACLSAEQAGRQAEERIKHLNLVLYAIRSVNQLIAREKDRDRLLKGACDRLNETRGYYNAWIALLDESGGLVATAEAGLGEGAFLPLLERLKRELTACGRRALSQSGVAATDDPPSACADCPLSASYAGRGAMTVRLEHGGKVYGLLSASIPAHLIADREEQVLFGEVAADIAFALHTIELEEERVRAEEVLQRRTKELATLNVINQDITASLDLDKTLQQIADSTRRLTGAKRSRILLINLQAHQLLKDVISGYPPEEKETYDYEQFEQGISGWAVLEKRSNLVPDVLADERSVGLSRAASVRRGTKSVAVAPLMVRGEVIGTLTAVNLREDPIFTQEDIALVEQLAAQAAIAIENARLYAATQQEMAERKQAEKALGERLQELTCLYMVHRDMQEDLPIDELCKRIIEHLVSAMQFPEITVPVIELDGRRFTSEGYADGLSHGLQAFLNSLRAEPCQRYRGGPWCVA